VFLLVAVTFGSGMRAASIQPLKSKNRSSPWLSTSVAESKGVPGSPASAEILP
jgi:hypothetical protein